jgi:hypothetical protein
VTGSTPVVLHRTEVWQQSAALGLGRVKTLLSAERSGLGEVAVHGHFGLDYARIAAMSGWIPMMFMTRVRL